jgi:hypothetical protein
LDGLPLGPVLFEALPVVVVLFLAAALLFLEAGEFGLKGYEVLADTADAVLGFLDILTRGDDDFDPRKGLAQFTPAVVVPLDGGGLTAEGLRLCQALLAFLKLLADFHPADAFAAPAVQLFQTFLTGLEFVFRLLKSLFGLQELLIGN